jgi:hypothetical protein
MHEQRSRLNFLLVFGAVYGDGDVLHGIPSRCDPTNLEFGKIRIRTLSETQVTWGRFLRIHPYIGTTPAG